MEQYIPYSLLCDLFNRNLETFTLTGDVIVRNQAKSPNNMIKLLCLLFIMKLFFHSDKTHIQYQQNLCWVSAAKENPRITGAWFIRYD